MLHGLVLCPRSHVRRRGLLGLRAGRLSSTPKGAFHLRAIGLENMMRGHGSHPQGDNGLAVFGYNLGLLVDLAVFWPGPVR